MPAARAEPGLVWDRRLISPERALELGGKAALIVTADWAELAQFEPEGGGPPQPDRGQLNIRCGQCQRDVRLVGIGPPNQQTVRLGEIQPIGFDVEGLLSSVLRHLVTHHDLPLNRSSDNGRTRRGD